MTENKTMFGKSSGDISDFFYLLKTIVILLTAGECIFYFSFATRNNN